MWLQVPNIRVGVFWYYLMLPGALTNLGVGYGCAVALLSEFLICPFWTTWEGSAKLKPAQLCQCPPWTLHSEQPWALFSCRARQRPREVRVAPVLEPQGHHLPRSFPNTRELILYVSIVTALRSWISLTNSKFPQLIYTRCLSWGHYSPKTTGQSGSK